jgi:hypothetical protein
VGIRRALNEEAGMQAKRMGLCRNLLAKMRKLTNGLLLASIKQL